MLFMAHLKLVPSPKSIAESEGVASGTRSGSACASSDSCARARDERADERERRKRWTWTGALEGAALTAVVTWRAFAMMTSRDEAIQVLAVLKGTYINFYASGSHFDSDHNIESWTLRRLGAASGEGEPAADGGARNAGATVLPMRGVALFVRPERDAAHGYFNAELHAAWDCGADATGRGGGHGGTAFHLQSGGCSNRRLEHVAKQLVTPLLKQIARKRRR